MRAKANGGRQLAVIGSRMLCHRSDMINPSVRWLEHRSDGFCGKSRGRGNACRVLLLSVGVYSLRVPNVATFDDEFISIQLVGIVESLGADIAVGVSTGQGAFGGYRIAFYLIRELAAADRGVASDTIYGSCAGAVGVESDGYIRVECVIVVTYPGAHYFGVAHRTTFVIIAARRKCKRASQNGQNEEQSGVLAGEKCFFHSVDRN